MVPLVLMELIATLRGCSLMEKGLHLSLMCKMRIKPEQSQQWSYGTVSSGDALLSAT